MVRQLSVSAHHDDQFTLKAAWKGQPRQGVFRPVKRERPYRHRTDSHSETHQVDDQVKTIQLHRWFGGEAFPRQPSSELLAGDRGFFDEQLALFCEPGDTRLAGLRKRWKRFRHHSWCDEGKSIRKAMGDAHGPRQSRWWAENAQVQLVPFDGGQHVGAAKTGYVAGDLRKPA